MSRIIIKREAELRHVLAHLMNAVEACARGHHASALDELSSVEGLVFFVGDSDEAIEAQLRSVRDGVQEEAAEEVSEARALAARYRDECDRAAKERGYYRQPTPLPWERAT